MNRQLLKKDSTHPQNEVR